MFSRNETIAGFDDARDAAINAARPRQERPLELTAPENYASMRVLEAQG